MKSFALAAAITVVLFAPTPIRADDSVSIPLARSGDIDQKLCSTVVSIDFDHATIDQATVALANLSRQLDPNHKGVQFVVQPEASVSGKPITLKLDGVPLREVIRYTCLLAGVHFTVEESTVAISPLGRGPGLIKRTFHVDPDFVEAATKAGILPSAQSQ